MDNKENAEKMWNYKAKEIRIGPIIVAPRIGLIASIIVEGKKVGYFNTETGEIVIYD